MAVPHIALGSASYVYTSYACKCSAEICGREPVITTFQKDAR